MVNSIQQATHADSKPHAPFFVTPPMEDFRDAYEQNRHRVYALAFWMTDNELAAEELMIKTFRRAFSEKSWMLPDTIDKALVRELRSQVDLGVLTLKCSAPDKVISARRNTLRVDLERAVAQLPATEKLIFLLHDVESYSHKRIAALLGLSEAQSKLGLHQARLCIREHLSR